VKSAFRQKKSCIFFKFIEILKQFLSAVRLKFTLHCLCINGSYIVFYHCDSNFLFKIVKKTSYDGKKIYGVRVVLRNKHCLLLSHFLQKLLNCYYLLTFQPVHLYLMSGCNSLLPGIFI
jgi:hypothetical protein